MGVVERTLACVADVLGAMAGERAGLRSGPAHNKSWMHAFELLDVCSLCIACFLDNLIVKESATFMGVQTKACMGLYYLIKTQF